MPGHPYTMGLLASMPDIEQDKSVRLQPIPGSPPDMTNPPKGCPFAPRCPYARSICAAELPDFVEVGRTAPDPVFPAISGCAGRCTQSVQKESMETVRNMSMSGENILEVENLTKHFKCIRKADRSCGGRSQLRHSRKARPWDWWESPAVENPPVPGRSSGCMT